MYESTCLGCCQRISKATTQHGRNPEFCGVTCRTRLFRLRKLLQQSFDAGQHQPQLSRKWFELLHNVNAGRTEALRARWDRLATTTAVQVSLDGDPLSTAALVWARVPLLSEMEWPAVWPSLPTLPPPELWSICRFTNGRDTAPEALEWWSVRIGLDFGTQLMLADYNRTKRFALPQEELDALLAALRVHLVARGVSDAQL